MYFTKWWGWMSMRFSSEFNNIVYLIETGVLWIIIIFWFRLLCDIKHSMIKIRLLICFRTILRFIWFYLSRIGTRSLTELVVLILKLNFSVISDIDACTTPAVSFCTHALSMSRDMHYIVVVCFVFIYLPPGGSLKCLIDRPGML